MRLLMKIKITLCEKRDINQHECSKPGWTDTKFRVINFQTFYRIESIPSFHSKLVNINIVFENNNIQKLELYTYKYGITIFNILFRFLHLTTYFTD